MSDLRVGVRRALPAKNFGETVGYVVGEMLDNIVSDSERAGVVPDWTKLFVGVTEEEAFPGTLVIRVTTTCTPPPATASTIAELLEGKKP